MNTNQTLSASIYRELFTDAEWDAIASALKDYADYGDEESNIADSIDAKINTIFRLTANWIPLHFPLMTTTYQRNALDISYNGWENYETWNVALWIQNDEGLYHLADECGDYETLVYRLYDEYGVTETRDGVKFADPKVNLIQLNSDVFDF